MTHNSVDSIDETDIKPRSKNWWDYLMPLVPKRVKSLFLVFDRKVDGAASFFLKHWGKSRFMIAMSKKAQYLGIERLWYKGPKAFIYFFLFYLIRDTILYIIIPIFFASLTAS
ncbi:MAG: hypothetical protein K9K67_03445 [Bacteriovoracaceae bacterium]|nr:hypothetical protein [Bacteriovoracaceae bacterium]